MDELVYASEKYRKDNKLKKPVTKEEKKERLAIKHEKLFNKLDKIAKKEQLSKPVKLTTSDKDTKTNKKPTISELKNLVANIK